MSMVRVVALIVVLVASSARADKPLKLDSPSVIAIDDESGQVLFAKDGDSARPIASLTKLFVALVLRKHNLDLESWTEITEEDVTSAEGGAASALRLGRTFRNVDLLHAMLLVSDNRVPSALARSVNLTPAKLLAEMQSLAETLGLTHTTFDDVTGILGNHSTARELAVVTQEVLRDPVLARIMRTRYARISSKSEAVTIDYKSTVSPLWNRQFKIRGGKTGTTEAAGHCMVIGAKIDDRNITMVFLGGDSGNSRFVDFARLARRLDHASVQ
jgi:D-alanyl-D-alanine endopeptidase (penicillin-binding protein 7)